MTDGRRMIERTNAASIQCTQIHTHGECATEPWPTNYNTHQPQSVDARGSFLTWGGISRLAMANMHARVFVSSLCCGKVHLPGTVRLHSAQWHRPWFHTRDSETPNFGYRCRQSLVQAQTGRHARKHAGREDGQHMVSRNRRSWPGGWLRRSPFGVGVAIEHECTHARPLARTVDFGVLAGSLLVHTRYPQHAAHMCILLLFSAICRWPPQDDRLHGASTLPTDDAVRPGGGLLSRRSSAACVGSLRQYIHASHVEQWR